MEGWDKEAKRRREEKHKIQIRKRWAKKSLFRSALSLPLPLHLPFARQRCFSPLLCPLCSLVTRDRLADLCQRQMQMMADTHPHTYTPAHGRARGRQRADSVRDRIKKPVSLSVYVFARLCGRANTKRLLPRITGIIVSSSQDLDLQAKGASALDTFLQYVALAQKLSVTSLPLIFNFPTLLICQTILVTLTLLRHRHPSIHPFIHPSIHSSIHPSIHP